MLYASQPLWLHQGEGWLVGVAVVVVAAAVVVVAAAVAVVAEAAAVGGRGGGVAVVDMIVVETEH